jgi:hypothetical protein
MFKRIVSLKGKTVTKTNLHSQSKIQDTRTTTNRRLYGIFFGILMLLFLLPAAMSPGPSAASSESYIGFQSQSHSSSSGSESPLETSTAVVPINWALFTTATPTGTEAQRWQTAIVDIVTDFDTSDPNIWRFNSSVPELSYYDRYYIVDSDDGIARNLPWGGNCVNYHYTPSSTPTPPTPSPTPTYEKKRDDILEASEISLIMAVALEPHMRLIPPGDQYDRLKAKAVKLISSLAYHHAGRIPSPTATPWSDLEHWGFVPDHYPAKCYVNWGTGRPASYAGLAAWLLWDEFTSTQKEDIRKMVEYEANRFINTTTFFHVPLATPIGGGTLVPGQPVLPNVGYRYDATGTLRTTTSTATPSTSVPDDYRDGYYMPGDTKAEENAWKARIVQLAAAMMPNHPNVDKWWSASLDLTVSAFSRYRDVIGTEMLHGREARAWLNGSNAENSASYPDTDGLIVNGLYLNPNYAAAIIHSAQAGIVNPLAGRSAPKGAYFNADQVYDTWVNLSFTPTATPCYNIPWVPPDVEQMNPCFNNPEALNTSATIYTLATRNFNTWPVHYPMGTVTESFESNEWSLDDGWQAIVGESPLSHVYKIDRGIFALTDAYAKAFRVQRTTGTLNWVPFGTNREDGRVNNVTNWESWHTDASRFAPKLSNAAEGYLLKWLEHQPYNQGTNKIAVSNVPPTWRDGDVGTVSMAGTGFFTPTLDMGNPGTFELIGYGPYINESGERFHFTYQEMRGDFDVIARKASWSESTGSIAQAGLMVREKLTAGSRMVRVLFQGNVDSGNTPYFKWRALEDNPAAYNFGLSTPGAKIRLVRKGDTFYGYVWYNDNWKEIYSATITMSSDVYVGLAASSNSSTTPLSVKFDEVTTWLTGWSALTTSTPTPSPTPSPTEVNNVVDNDPWTVWARDNLVNPPWIAIEYPSTKKVTAVSIEWFLGYQRAYKFKIQAWNASTEVWYDVSPPSSPEDHRCPSDLTYWCSNGTMSSEAKYYLSSPVDTLKIRIVGYGFTGQGVPNGPWTSIRELKIYGRP